MIKNVEILLLFHSLIGKISTSHKCLILASYQRVVKDR